MTTAHITFANLQEALMGVMVCAGSADGELGADETALIVAVCLGVPAFRGAHVESLAPYIRRVVQAVDREGGDAVLSAAVAALPRDAHELAFLLAADVILADGQVAAKELDLFRKLAGLLGLTAPRAQELSNVAMIRNRVFV